MIKSRIIQTARRYHDISCGHRVMGHENKCRGLHGHNYRVHFGCAADNLDKIGRVIDFGVIKTLLCDWLEENWDHKMLLWDLDPVLTMQYQPSYRPDAPKNLAEFQLDHKEITEAMSSFLAVPFNPTAENMATYLLTEIGPRQLKGTGVRLIQVTIEETRKCSAMASDLNALMED